MKRLILVPFLLLFVFFSYVLIAQAQITDGQQEQEQEMLRQTNALVIDTMRQMRFDGSDLVIEEELPKGSNYFRYIASYFSQGNKIYGLLTIPDSQVPEGGFPAVIFAHGYIPPKEYKTGEEYSSYIDVPASQGYIVFAPDFRGHGRSWGKAEGTYFSAGYTIDFLNAVATIAKHKEVNKDKIGAWGHSMGGNIVLRALTVSQDIKAAVIWSGVVGDYSDLLYNWDKSKEKEWETSEYFANMIQPRFLFDHYGNMRDNPTYWKAISPYSSLDQIAAPIQLHHGQQDTVVPYAFSEHLNSALEQAGKYHEFYYYTDAGHNFLDWDYAVASERTLNFLNSYLQ